MDQVLEFALDTAIKKNGPLTAEDAQWLLSNIKQPQVKVEPRGRGGGGTWGKAMLISVNARKGTAVIMPHGHKKTEEMDLKYLRKWKSHNQEYLTEPLPLDPGPLKVSIAERVKEPPPPQIRPLFTTGGLSTPKAESPPPQAAPEKPKRTAKKFSDETFLEAQRLRKMGKTHKEISLITGIPFGSLTAALSKQISGGIGVKNGDQVKVTATEEKYELSPIEPEPEVVVIVPEPTTRPEWKPPVVQATALQQTGGHEKMLEALRAIMRLPISDTAKLLSIEALIS